MKIYSDNHDYQTLVAVLYETKNALDTAKTEMKEVRVFFKKLKKNAETKAAIFATYLQFKQAKLKQKIEKLAVRRAELNLLGFIHDFKETHKQELVALQNVDKNKKAKSKKSVNSETDFVEKPTPKEGKVKQSIKSDKPKKVVMTTTKKAVTNWVFETGDTNQTDSIILTNDLTVIEGIGPKIAKILSENGVNSFKTLITTPVEDIKTWLKGHKMPFINPTTWAEQAQLADEGKIEAFEALKKALKGGKRAQQ